TPKALKSPIVLVVVFPWSSEDREGSPISCQSLGGRGGRFPQRWCYRPWRAGLQLCPPSCTSVPSS
ncbi:hypothetical protein KUCAC02_029497, partial [Chaenocephalus aceratus]